MHILYKEYKSCKKHLQCVRWVTHVHAKVELNWFECFGGQKGYGLLNILLRSTFSLQYGHVCFLPTMHQPRMQNSWNLRKNRLRKQMCASSVRARWWQLHCLWFKKSLKCCHTVTCNFTNINVNLKLNE